MKELTPPLILIAIALTLILGVSAFSGGAEGAAVGLATTLIVVGAKTVIGIVALFIAALFFGMGFGYLHSAIVKMAAVMVVPLAVSMLIPIPILGWLISLLIYWGLLEYFFDLGPQDLVICVLLIFLVQVGAGLALAAMMM